MWARFSLLLFMRSEMLTSAFVSNHLFFAFPRLADLHRLRLLIKILYNKYKLNKVKILNPHGRSGMMDGVGVGICVIFTAFN